MNPELEQLVDYAIVDGYITDKEKKVLFKKAEAQGFDTDELEMILNGKLAEKNEANRPKVKKCPSCGEVLNGMSRVCPSCDYVLMAGFTEDTETLALKMQKIDNSIYALSSLPKSTNTQIHNTVFKIYITAGLYALYKKLIQKEQLFNSYGIYQDKIVKNIKNQLESLKTVYGDDSEVSRYIDEKTIEYTSVLNKRNAVDVRTAFFSFLAFAAIFTVGSFMVMAIADPENTTENSVEDDPKAKIESLIATKNIGEGYKVLPLIQDEESRKSYLSQLWILEIDSLTGAGNYDTALEKANVIDNSAYGNEREEKIDEILDKEITTLIGEKEFKKAKERADLASYDKRQLFEDRIALAEKINKKKK